ncbi:MAG TPA: hypothetical protein VN327_12180 [Pseudonocardiaceae bacterium]|nr:hypothetical protein [Pseudonocardiaceae bacterium]
MTRPGRWARSPLDYHAHLLLPEGEHPQGVLKAQCGAVLTASATQYDQTPGGLTCQRCRLITEAAPTPPPVVGCIIEQLHDLLPVISGTGDGHDPDSPDPGTSWWLSTADWHWHLPNDGDPPEALMAHCGAPLASDAVRNADPMDDARCAACANAPDTTGLHRQDSPRADPPRRVHSVQVSGWGTRTDDGADCTLLAICETGGTWMIHSLNLGAVRLTEEEEALRMAKGILHLVGARHLGERSLEVGNDGVGRAAPRTVFTPARRPHRGQGD